MTNSKKIIGRGFCDIQNNQGRGRGYPGFVPLFRNKFPGLFQDSD